jgi:hypothetical protein
MLEAPQIRIGGSQTGEILLENLNNAVFRSVTFTFGSPASSETILYIPRYFENPFFSSNTSPGVIDNNPNNTTGIPHVVSGVVSFVSALGKTHNVSGGDVNLYGLQMTGVDGVFFDGRGGDDNYAAKDQSTANNSLVSVFNGRVGRTVDDLTIGNGGDLQAFLPLGFLVDDGALGTRVLTEQANAAAKVAGGQVTGIASDSVLSNIQVTATSVYTAAQITASGTPSVTVTSTVGTGGTASSFLAVNSLALANGGSGFSAVPGVIITGGGGAGATATAAVNVDSAVVVSGGGGYLAAPAVTISAPPAGGTQATATAVVVAGAVTSITINNSGSGYTTTPTITIAPPPPGGTTATANPLLAVDSLTLTAGGTLYTSVPTVSFVGDGTNAAASVATLAVAGARVTNPGTGYSTAPTITIAPPTGGVSPTALAAITSGGGKSYSSAPPVALYGGGVQLASARAIQSDDGVIQFIAPQITGLGYTSAPEVSIIDPSGKGTGATATAFVNAQGQLTPFNMVNLGEGYEAPPTVTISGPQGSGAVARAEVSGYLQKLGVSGVGSGYTTTPTVSITGGGGVGAQAVAFKNANGQISPFEVIGAPSYLSVPTITITGDGQGATATAILSNGTSGTLLGIQVVNSGGLYTTVTDVKVDGVSGVAQISAAYSPTDFGGTITPVYIKNPGMGYSSTPIVALLGGGVAPSSPTASATTAKGVTALYITDPGKGYAGDPSQFKIKIAGGGGTGAEAVLDGRYTFVDLNSGLTPIALTARGTSYSITDEPMISLTGGGLAQAQARAILDKNVTSSTYGQIIAYEITDAGLGYTSNPTLEVGWGQAFGNFGEYGISTEAVDRNVGSGYISLSNLGGARIGGMTINAPIRTGDAQGVPGGNAVSGSILLDAGPGIAFNTDGGADGIIITGDTSVVPYSSGAEFARSGSVTLSAGGTIANDLDSSLVALSGSSGVPIQIGTATGANQNSVGALNVTQTVRDSLTVFLGDIKIYAVAPGQVEAAQGGRPLDPNHPQPVPRTSNDLKLTGIAAPGTVTDASENEYPNEPLVTIEVGAFHGKLTLLRRPESEAVATVRSGAVTLISPDESGILYSRSPTVIITGGGIVPAEISAFVEGGSVVGENPNRPNELTVDNPGDGYYVAPAVTITGDGQGATALAVIGSDPLDSLTFGKVLRVNLTNPGYGYTSRPTVTIGAPAGIQATATATVVDQTIPVTTLTVSSGGITNPGVGYLTPPLVTVGGGRYGTATATATVDTTPGSSTYAQITEITITLNADTFVSGAATITIGQPASQAQAVARRNTSGEIVRYEITNSGGGYTGSPQVVLVTDNGDPYNIGSSGKLGLFADRLQIFDAGTPSSLLITAGVAAVAPYTNQFPMDIGSEVAGRTSLVVRELQRFSADTLVTGRRDSSQPIVGAGVINISQAISADDLRLSGGLVLAGTREVFSTGISGADFENIVVDAGGTVLMTGTGNASHYFSGIIRDSGLAFGEANITATGQAIVAGGQLTSITPTLGGTGYYENPIVTIGAPTSGGTQAIAVAIIDSGVVTGYRIINGGSGYETPPAITISDASPASFNLTSKLRTVGTGNMVVPLTIGEVFANAAEFTGKMFYQGITTQNGDIRINANDLQQTRLVGFLDTTGGGAFPVSSSSVFLAPYNSGVLAQVQAQAIGGQITSGSFTIVYGGAGYLTTPQVFIDDPTGSGAAATAIVDVNGKVTGFTITSAGSNYSNPTIRVAAPSSSRPLEVIYNQATPLVQVPLTTLQVVRPGDGYVSVPTVSFSGGGSGTAMAVMSLGTVAVPTTGQGSGYTDSPTVTITGGGGLGASAEAIVNYLTGRVEGIRVVDAGYGYTSQPTVTITGGGGSGATATAFLAVQSLTLASGVGYTTTPTISISAPPNPDIVRFPNLASGTATGMALGGTLSFRIGNTSAPGLELVKAASVVIGSSSASSITLKTDFAYNYGAYPMAPRTLVLETAGNVALGISQIPPSPSPIPKTSSIRIPNLSIISGGTVSLGAVAGAAAPIHTVRGFSASVGSGGLTFETTLTPLVISDLLSLGGAMGISGNGVVNLTAPNIQVPIMPPTAAGLYSTIRTLGDVTLTANGVMSDSGTVSVAIIDQWVPSAYTSSTIRTSGNISLVADRIELGDNGVNTAPGILTIPILSAGGRVNLQAETAATSVTIGIPKPVNFGFTPTELANIGASILQIGNTSGGAVSIQALVTLVTTRLTTALSLISGSTIGDNGGTSGINYGGGLRLSSVGSISFTGSGNDFGTVAAYSGGNNPITLSSGAFSIGVVDTVTGINAGSSRVTLQPNVAGTAINLGTKSGWSFTDSELDLVTASILQIGRSNAGQITVSEAMILPSTVSILDLETAAGVADVGGISGLSVTSLAIRAGTGAVSLDGAGNNVSNLAGVVSNGAFSFTDNAASAVSPLNITSVDLIDGINTFTGNGAITLTADDMNIVQPVQAGSGVITLQPLDPTANISLNDPTASLALSTAELQILSSTSTVIIGRANGTGTISLGGSGNIDLSAMNYSLTLRGASSPLVFSAPVLPAVTGGLTLADNNTLTLDLGTGAVTSPFVGTDVTIGGATGTLLITSAGSVGTLSAPLTTSVAQLSGASVAAASTATSSGLFLSNVTALDVTEAVSVTGNATALGNINLTTSFGGLSNSTGSITSTDGSVTLLGATTVTIGRAVSAATTLTATASGGALVTGAAGTLTAVGNVTGTGTMTVTLDGAVNSGGAISFTATTPLTGTFANTAAITSTLVNTLNPDGSLSPTITLQADTVTLGGTVTAAAGSGGIQLEPVSVSRDIEVFGAAQTVLPGFFIGNTYFGFLGGTAPVTIGRLNGTGLVLVHAKAGINRNLTIQAGAQAFSATPTFTIDGNVITTGSNLAFNGGGGYLLLDTGATIGTGAGAVSLTGQKVDINGDVVAGFLGNVYNGGSGGAYLNYIGPPAPTANDLVLVSSGGTGTITTGIFGFGGNGTVYVGTTVVGGSSSIGGVTINSQGLSLSSLSKISLEGNITSVGDPLTINGNLYLSGDRVISMGGGDLELLGGVNSLNGLENLNLNMGAGALTLAGGTLADRIGTLSVTQGAGSTIQFGQALAADQPELGLTMGFTEDFNLTSAVTLEGTLNIALTGYNGADLVLGNFSEAASATAPLSLTTVGGGNITTGAVAVSGLTVTSSGAATLGGAVTTTGATTVQATSLTTSSTVTAASGGIQIFADTMSLAGQVTATTGNVQAASSTVASQLVLGGAGMTSSTLLKLQAPTGAVTLGRADGTGGILVAGAVDLSTSGTSNYEFLGLSGGLTFQGTVTLPSTDGMLTLNLGVGDVTSSGGLDYSGDVLQITQARDVNIGTSIPTFGSMAQSFRSIHLRNYGSLTIAGPIDASGLGNGTISIRTLSGDLTLASTIKGGLIQLGAAQSFNNQAGSNPFTNRGGGRTLVYSAGQRFDTPYNFAGLNGFGVAFGQPYGSMPSSGNYLVYSSYADVGLDNGWQYGSFFAGNSVSALMPYGLFEDVNRLYQPKARSFNLEYMLYPDRVEPETRTLPAAMLGDLEQKFGRPPTLDEIQAREVAVREAAMAKKGAIMERSSFDPAITEKDEEERAEGEKVENSDGGVPQAKVERIEPISDGAKPMARLPVNAPQAGRSATTKPGSTGPILRSGPMRSVAELRPAEPAEVKGMGKIPAQAVHLDVKSVIEQERASAEVGIAPPIAAGR